MWPSTIQPNLRAMLDLRVCVCGLVLLRFAKAKTMPVSAEPQCPNWFSKRYPAKPRHIESAVHACLSNALGGPANFCNSFGTLVFPTSVWFFVVMHPALSIFLQMICCVCDIFSLSKRYLPHCSWSNLCFS